MKKYLTLFINISIVILYTCCQGNSQKTEKPSHFTHIDLAGNLQNTTDGIPLSNAARTIEVIPLETKDECIISEIEKMWLTDDNIIIYHHYKQPLLRFSRDGKFLNKIGVIGKGPGECVLIGDIRVDDAKEEVYINLGDGRQAGFMVYDFDGNFKRKITFNTYKQFATLSFTLFFANKTPFFKQDLPVMNPEVPMWNLAILDSLLVPKKTISNPLYNGREKEIAENHCLYYGWTQYYIENNPINIYQNELKIMYHGGDTIYQYESNLQDLTPAYSLALGQRPSFSKCREWIKNPDFFNYLWVNNFYDTHDFVYLEAGKDEYLYLAQFDKHQGTLEIIKEKGEIFESTFPNGWIHRRRRGKPLGLTNDLCGYPASFPPHPISNKGHWGIAINSYQVLNDLKPENLEELNVKNPEIRDKLIKLSQTLSDESNPVLFIATLK